MSKNTGKILIKYLAITPKYNNIRICNNVSEKYYHKYDEEKISKRIKEEEKFDEIRKSHNKIALISIVYTLSFVNVFIIGFKILKG